MGDYALTFSTTVHDDFAGRRAVTCEGISVKDRADRPAMSYIQSYHHTPNDVP